MVLTKTQIKIMNLFTSEIVSNFSLTDISNNLKLQYRAVHRAIQPLVKNKFLFADNKRYRLNYKSNHQELAYIEHIRCKELLAKPKNGVLSLFMKDTLNQVKEDHFILIIFGSTVKDLKPRDVDILVIVDKIDKVEPLERQLSVIADRFTLKFDIHVVSDESLYEMLEKRDQLNVINEVLNKHIIVHGAETFYRMLSKGRR